MITLLTKFFIKNRPPKEQRQAYGRLCSAVGVCLNLLLFCGKYFAGWVSGSLAVTADAFNNLSDAGSSFLTLAGFIAAGRQPDSEHPFGHGRLEYLSGFVVSLAILLMGFELLKSSVSKILHPQPVDTGLLTMGILAASILVKLFMAYYNRRIGDRIHSDAMRAAALDALSDMVSTGVVLLAMLVMRFASVNIDGVCGLVVALFILWTGVCAARDTVNPLLGMAPDRTLVQDIRTIVMAHPKVLGIHDLAVHDYGPGRRMISLHAEVPGEDDVFRLHDMIDGIERELGEKLGVEAVIHLDPIETDNEQIAQLRALVEQKIHEIDRRITIHDFRIVVCEEHKNLTFDAVIPYEMRIEPDALKALIEEKLSDLPPYRVIVRVDQSYVPI